MRRWAIWVLGVAAALAAGLGLAMWLGSLSAENEIRRLMAEGKRIGLVFEEPVYPANHRAEKMRVELDKLSEAQKPFEKEFIPFDTEVVHELRRIVRETADIYDLGVELSREPTLGRPDEREIFFEILAAPEVLEANARLAAIEKDLQKFLVDAQAIRKLSSLLPKEDFAGCLFRTLLLNYYAPLIQTGAERFNGEAGALRVIDAEAAKWKEIDYGDAVRGTIRHELITIEYDESQIDARESVLDTIRRWIHRDRTSIARQKIAALKHAIEAWSNWDNDSVFIGDQLNMSREGRGFYYTLKQQELEQRTLLRAIRLGVRAQLRKAETGRWPSMAALADEGLATTDPITKKQYTWKSVEGKPRVFGSHFGRQGIEPKVLLISWHEEQRMNRK